MRTVTFPLTGFVLCGVAWAGTTGWDGRSVAQHATTAVDPSRALTGTKGVLPRGFMAPIARLFGLSPCDDARSWYVEDRGYASLNVNNSAISCTVWPSPDRGFAAFFPPDRTLADHLAAARRCRRCSPMARRTRASACSCCRCCSGVAPMSGRWRSTA